MCWSWAACYPPALRLIVAAGGVRGAPRHNRAVRSLGEPLAQGKVLEAFATGQLLRVAPGGNPADVAHDLVHFRREVLACGLEGTARSASVSLAVGRGQRGCAWSPISSHFLAAGGACGCVDLATHAADGREGVASGPRS